jgi:hypothetical protein
MSADKDVRLLEIIKTVETPIAATQSQVGRESSENVSIAVSIRVGSVIETPFSWWSSRDFGTNIISFGFRALGDSTIGGSFITFTIGGFTVSCTIGNLSSLRSRNKS